MKLFPFVVLFSFCSGICFAQLKPLSVYYSHNSKKADYQKLRKIPIKIGPNNTLYIHNKLVFEPSGDSSARYEILNKKYIFISFFDSSYKYQSIHFSYWNKSNVTIISIKNPDQKYHINIGERCRSSGVIEFLENEKLLRIKDKRTDSLVNLTVSPLKQKFYN